MPSDPDAFVASLTALSEHTRRAYGHDAREFVAWCERGACTDPGGLDHRTVRRYLAYLQTRGFARPTIARKAAAVRAYARFLRRRGVLHRDLAATVQTPPAARKLPRMPKAADAAAMLASVKNAAVPDEMTRVPRAP